MHYCNIASKEIANNQQVLIYKKWLLHMIQLLRKRMKMALLGDVQILKNLRILEYKQNKWLIHCSYTL